MWVTSFLGNELVKISAATNSVVGTVSLGSEPNGIIALDGYLWVTGVGGGEVAVIRPASRLTHGPARPAAGLTIAGRWMYHEIDSWQN